MNQNRYKESYTEWMNSHVKSNTNSEKCRAEQKLTEAGMRAGNGKCCLRGYKVLVLYIYYTAKTTVIYNYLFQNSLKDFEAREMVQLLRGHAALAEDLKSVPRTHIRQFTAACTSSCRGICTSGLYGHVNICACTHTQMSTHEHIYK